MSAVSPPMQYFGGKSEMAEWIISHFPEHLTYVETHGGMASVLLAKQPSPIEVYNDLDGALVNFWRMCREQASDLALEILFSPYSRAEWQQCKSSSEDGGELERARKYAVVGRQSMSGAWGRAWSSVVAHSRRGMASGNSRYLNMPEAILAAADRLSRVQIECMNACNLISRYDRPVTMFYIDPPYTPDCRQPGVYRCEMSMEDHVNLLDVLTEIKGKAIISGYDNPLYAHRLAQWNKVTREVPCRSNVNSKGSTSDRPTRTEVLWMNY